MFLFIHKNVRRIHLSLVNSRGGVSTLKGDLKKKEGLGGRKKEKKTEKSSLQVFRKVNWYTATLEQKSLLLWRPYPGPAQNRAGRSEKVSPEGSTLICHWIKIFSSPSTPSLQTPVNKRGLSKSSPSTCLKGASILPFLPCIEFKWMVNHHPPLPEISKATSR